MKFVKAILTGILMITMTACAKAPAAQESAVPESPAAETVKEEEPTKISDEEVQKLLDIYKTVLDETFGAEIDFSKPAKQDELASYYTVKNFRTIDEIKEYIFQYCTESACPTDQIDYDFTEEDGKVLAVRGGRGYAFYGIDPKTWERVDDTSVNVQFMILDDVVKDAMALVTFAREDGVWKVSSFTAPDVE